MPLGILLAVVALSCASRRKPRLGMRGGRLSGCPGSPNCVCSEDKGKPSWIEPLTFQGTPDEAWKVLKDAVKKLGGTIEKEGEGYLWATFRTKLFRFVDDVEFRMDAERRVIHVRSASRVGYSDLGVNRKRVELLRTRFDERQSTPPGKNGTVTGK